MYVFSVSLLHTTNLHSDNFHPSTQPLFLFFPLSNHFLIFCSFLLVSFFSFLIRLTYLSLPYGTGQAIIFLPDGFFLFSSPKSQRPQIGCLPYFHTWCGLSVNRECKSEMCCTWLTENTGCKKIAKNSPSGHHHRNLSGYIFATKEHIDNWKKTC